MDSGDTTVDMGDWDPNVGQKTNGTPAEAAASAEPPENSPPPPTGQRLSDRAGGELKVRSVGPGTATPERSVAEPIISDRGSRSAQVGILAVLLVGSLVLGGLLIALLTRSPLFGNSDAPSVDETAEAGTGTTEQATQQAGPAAPSIPSSQTGALESLRCPVMTDSVDRLFLASLNRSPSEAEFAQAVRQYRTGRLSLQDIAQNLAESDGLLGLDDEAFVDRVYRNTKVRRLPENRDVWITALQTGQPRGTFVVAISESQEFVEATRTATPLSGFLRTYPAGTHWYCGVGPRDDLPIRPLTETAVYADYMFHNAGVDDSQTGISTVIGADPYLPVASGSLPPDATSYRWNGLFEGDGDYGTGLDIDAGLDTWWAIVFYPESIGEGRLGWQISS